MSIEIETVEQLVRHRYTVSTFCPKCGRRGPDLDLETYIQQGRGAFRPIDLGLRHARCKSVLQLLISPPKGYGK